MLYLPFEYNMRRGFILLVLLMWIILYNWIFQWDIVIGYQGLNNIININWGIDGINITLLMLTASLTPIALLSNWYNLKHSHNTYINIIIILGILLLLNFYCLDMLSFYVLFESTLAPLYILIGIYGGKDKQKAGNYILMYTLLSSLFMLLTISIYIYIENTTEYVILYGSRGSLVIQNLLWIGLAIAIAVKTPIFPVHTWLPVVHSESPLGGSILLAGIVLKLAIYGIVRFLIYGFIESTILFIPIIFTISVLTVILTSLITLRQIDVKEIIAYSSVSHLGVSLIGVTSNKTLGLEGSLLLCLAHGTVSPGLFAAVGGNLYDRYHDRFRGYYQGLTVFMPIFMLFFILFSFSNIGTPLSSNFLGEFLSINGGLQRSIFLGILIASSVLLSACFQMSFTTELLGGELSKYINITLDLTKRELYMSLALFIPVLIMGIYLVPMTDSNILAWSSLIYNN